MASVYEEYSSNQILVSEPPPCNAVDEAVEASKSVAHMQALRRNGACPMPLDAIPATPTAENAADRDAHGHVATRAGQLAVSKLCRVRGCTEVTYGTTGLCAAHRKLRHNRRRTHRTWDYSELRDV